MSTSGLVPDPQHRMRVDAAGAKGVQAGSHNFQYNDYRTMAAAAGPAVRSAYRHLVARIAPQELYGREAELAELADFCTAPDRSPYVWWRAPAWAGKSALMAWFVLNPPPGVRVVSFFITARWAGQDNRVAFRDALLEQLAELLGGGLPAFLPEATRDAHLIGMLDEAAQLCQDRGERLVLLVDGLDEDRGVTSGPDAYSIAALLPARPPAGMRVIVAGRPNPPIPTDVPPHHPLRDPGIVRPLTDSEYARVSQGDMLRELKRLLAGTPVEQDLLGLLTAAGGGLSGPDLAELTGWPVWQVEEHLQTVAGRSFTRHGSRWQRETAPEVYVLGHEELRRSAVERLGAVRLAGYRQRLHVWAERYREQGWPAGTPQYLLRGYFRMLQVTGDVDRMVAAATDPARHDRMLDITGGDSTALADIIAAQDAILARDEPDLLAMARLAMYRDRISRRNANIPTELPAVWAALGNYPRAEALVGAMTDPERQAAALMAVAEVAAAGGDVARARAAAEQAEAVADSIIDLGVQASILAAVAQEAASIGDLGWSRTLVERAESVAESITDLRAQAWALVAVTRAVVAGGDVVAACAIGKRAEAAAKSINNPNIRVCVLAAVAQAVAGAGDGVWARAVVEQAETVAGVTGSDDQALLLAVVASAFAGLGELSWARVLVERAEAVARFITNPEVQAWALRAVTRAVADAGDLDRAETMARSITELNVQAKAFVTVVVAAISAGDSSRAEAVARSITVTGDRASALGALARAAVGVGDWEQARALAEEAEAVARSISDVDRRARALLAVAGAVVCTGDVDRGESVTRSITEPGPKAEAFAAVIEAVAGVGDLERARALAEQAEPVARSIIRRHDRVRALPVASEATASGRSLAGAESSRSTIDPYDAVYALVMLARAAKGIGELDSARAWTEQAEAVAQSIIDPDDREFSLVAVTEAVADVGDQSRAAAIARSITDSNNRAKALLAVAKAVIEAGDLDRAEGVAWSITEPGPQTEALAAVGAAVAEAGDLERARDLVGQAEAAARSITDLDNRVRALLAVAEAVSIIGDLRRAQSLIDQADSAARSITSEFWQGWALLTVVEVVADAGDLDRAEAVAHAIAEPDMQAQALALLAGQAEAGAARVLLARAFLVGDWTTPLDQLAKLQPDALLTVADEFVSLSS